MPEYILQMPAISFTSSDVTDNKKRIEAERRKM